MLNPPNLKDSIDMSIHINTIKFIIAKNETNKS